MYFGNAICHSEYLRYVADESLVLKKGRQILTVEGFSRRLVSWLFNWWMWSSIHLPGITDHWRGKTTTQQLFHMRDVALLSSVLLELKWWKGSGRTQCNATLKVDGICTGHHGCEVTGVVRAGEPNRTPEGRKQKSLVVANQNKRSHLKPYYCGAFNSSSYRLLYSLKSSLQYYECFRITVLIFSNFFSSYLVYILVVVIVGGQRLLFPRKKKAREYHFLGSSRPQQPLLNPPQYGST